MIINSQIKGSGTAPEHYLEKIVDENGKLSNNVSNFINLNGVTELGAYALAYAYIDNTNLPATIDMSGIKTISGKNACASMFNNTRNIKKIDLSGLESITGANSAFDNFCSGAALYQNTDVEEVDLSGLKSITNSEYCFSYAFVYNNKITSFILTSLETLSQSNTNQTPFGSIFNYNNGIKIVSFPKLSTINCVFGISYMQPFSSCNYLESVSFGGLKASTFANQVNQLQYLFNNNTGSQAPNGCTVHFPSNFDPSDPNHTFDASTLTGYPTFNGNASYIHVAFDLPATE